MPVKASMKDFIFHLVAVGPGKGPILLYWYDVDGTAKTVTIRGRLITGKGIYTKDFSISRAGAKTSTFGLTNTGPPVIGTATITRPEGMSRARE